MFYNKKIYLFLFILILLTISSLFYINKRFPNQTLIFENKTPTKPTKTISPSTTTPTIEIAEILFKAVPFTPQAPTANWDIFHNEACEEAAMLMVATYFNSCSSCDLTELENKTVFPNLLPPKLVEKEFERLTNWEQQTFGYHLDINSKEIIQTLAKNYNLKAELVESFTEQDLKKALNEDKIVIASFNGQKLGNPNYKQPGPIHHVLVIKGYNKMGYITNDPGTRKGMNYVYDFQTLEKASGDWNHETKNIDETEKNIIVVSKPK